MPRVAKEKVPNYTPEQTAQIVADYAGGQGKSVQEIAEALNKSVRSVIGKLVRERVYVAKVTEPKAPQPEGPTKKDLLADLSKHGFDPKGFEPATKDALTALVEYLDKAA